MKIHRYLVLFFIVMFGILAQNHIVYAGVTATTCPADHPATTDPQVECEEPCPTQGEECYPPSAPLTQWVLDGPQPPLAPGTIQGPSIICVGVATSYTVVGASDNDTEKKQFRTIIKGTKDAKCKCIGAGHSDFQDYVPSITKTDTATPFEWRPTANFPTGGSFKSDTPGTFQIDARVKDSGAMNVSQNGEADLTPDYEVKVIGVKSLSPDSGQLITDPNPLPDDPTDTRVYVLSKQPSQPTPVYVTITAAPTPNVAEADLPSCWALTGGQATSTPKLSRQVRLDQAGLTTITATAGTWSGQGAASGHFKRRVKIYVVEVVAVDWKVLTGPLSSNPAIMGGGQRIFPDRATWNGTDQNTVTVEATINPAIPDVEVQWAWFDIDDPSANTSPVDTNGSMGGDNRDTTPSIPILVSQGPTITDSQGKAVETFKVGWNAGDNYRVAAACDPQQNAQLQINQPTAPFFVAANNTATLADFVGRLTPMLTVWRKLHLEVDSMAAVAGTGPQRNLADGDIVRINGNAAGGQIAFSGKSNHFVTGLPNGVTDNSAHLPTDNGRFENGRVRIGLGQWTQNLLGNSSAYFRTKGTSVTGGTSFNISFVAAPSSPSDPFVNGQIISMLPASVTPAGIKGGEFNSEAQHRVVG